MEKRVMSSLLTQLLLFTTFSVCYSQAESSTPQDLFKGYRATPNQKESFFQSLLTDSYGNYSFGFLRVNKNQLTVAVIHVKSAETIWTPNLSRLASWASTTELYFNGSLVLSDDNISGVLWSTFTDGHRVWLSNTSDLQVLDQSLLLSSALWQSFNFPSDTLVENQNFTSNMSLHSANGVYSMRLGSNFIGLYADFNPGSSRVQMYWKHKALEAMETIVEGKGPIYAALSPIGFLGMYQNGSPIPVDVESFNSYQDQRVGVRRLKLESDGNLKAYYWTGSNWTLDYQGIRDPCQLPSGCGSYGLCQSGKGCSCLDNTTDYSKSNGQCISNDNNKQGDFCRAYSYKGKFNILRIVGVELPNKELMEPQKMASLEECENACQVNCICWGAVYSNSSGFCYILDYPIQTLVKVGDDTKVGYFKERQNNGNSKIKVGLGIGLAILFLLILVTSGILGWRWYKTREGKRGVKMYAEEAGVVGVGPYKGLSDESFRSIELSER